MSDAFVRIYEQNVHDVYGYLVYRLGSRVEAQRLTEQTFERAARRWRNPGPDPEEERLWLLGIARTLAGHTEPASGGDPGLPEDLAKALAQLDRSARSAVALRWGGALTGPEIAKLLGVSERTVRRRLSRGLRRLRTELGDGSRRSTPGGAEVAREDGGEGEEAGA